MRATHFQAIGFALFAFTIWVLSDTFIKLAGEANLPPFEIICSQGFLCIPLLMLKARLQGNVKNLWPKKPRLQIGRGVLEFVSLLFTVIALKHLQLPVFYIVVFSAPLITAIGAALFLKEHLKTGKCLAIIAGFAGVIIAINPGHNAAGNDWIGYSTGFAGSLCFAINMIWLRVMTQSESVDSVTLFTSITYFVLGFVGTAFHPAPVSGKLLTILFANSIAGMLGNMAFYKAFKHTSAANVAQVHYTQIVTGSVIAWFIWHDKPTIHLIIGALIIVASGLYMASEARKSDKAALIH